MRLENLTGLRWSSMANPGNGTVVGGTFAHARRLPTTVPAGATIALWVVITKPRCAPGTVVEIDNLPLRWQALDVHHVFTLPLQIASHLNLLPIDVCWPATARRYISRIP